MQVKLALCLVMIWLMVGSAQADVLLKWFYPPSCRVPRLLKSAGGDPEAVPWAQLPSIGPLWVHTGERIAPYETTVKIAYDSQYFYLYRKAKDPDIRATFTEHDSPVWEEECMEFFCAPFGTPYKYCEINVSPLNTVFDALQRWPAGGSGLMEMRERWTCEGLVSKTVVHGTVNDSSDVDEGWENFMALPFRSLVAVSTQPGTVWRGNFYRIMSAPEPGFFAWSPTLVDPAKFHVPESSAT